MLERNIMGLMVPEYSISYCQFEHDRIKYIKGNGVLTVLTVRLTFSITRI